MSKVKKPVWEIRKKYWLGLSSDVKALENDTLRLGTMGAHYSIRVNDDTIIVVAYARKGSKTYDKICDILL